MSTEAEVKVYAEYMRDLIHRTIDALDGLTQEQINWDPPWHDSNPLFAIATHSLDCARAWVAGIVAGLDASRDREAEFASSGTMADLEQLAHDVSAEIEKALSEMDAKRLDHMSVPPKELWGTGDPYEVSGRWALAHMIEHMSIHLGEIHVTRDVAILEVQG
jgi:uncharacterized damage-inducible protein DinB